MHWNTGWICVAALFATSMAEAAVKLPSVFGSHMVLQRDQAVPVWGNADAGEEVTVSFRDQKLTTKADDKGKWSVKLAALSLGDAATLTVAGTNTITFDDVLVGDPTGTLKTCPTGV